MNMIKTKKMTASKVKTSEIFTDRNEIQKAFRRGYEELAENILEAQTDDDLGSQILNIYGISGIGKTSVLEKFRSITEEEYGKEDTKANCLYYSFEVKREQEKESFLLYLAYLILKNNPGTDLSKFLYAYRKSLLETDSARMVIDDLNTMDRKKINIGNEALKAGAAAAVDVVPMIAKSFPMANTVLELAGWLIDGVSEKYFEGSLEKKVRSDIDGHSNNELRKKLHQWFADEAYTYFRELEKPFVIFLDGFEKYEVRDPEQSGTEVLWLKDLIESLPNILWVIAGREKLNWGEEFGLNQTNQICLDDFSPSEVREYFDRYWEKYGDRDPKKKIREDLIDPIRALTRGVPIYLRLCLDNFEKYEDKENITIEAFGKDTTELLVRFFDNYSEDQKSAMLFLCCLPDGWTSDNVFKIYDMMKNKTGDRTGIRLDLGVLNSLLKTVAFEEHGSGYRIHSVIRESVLKNAVDLIKERLDAITGAMKDYADLCGESWMSGKQIRYYEEAAGCWKIWGETHEGWEDKYIEYKDKLMHLYFSRFNGKFEEDDIDKAIVSATEVARFFEEKNGGSAWDTLEKKSLLAFYLSFDKEEEQRTDELFHECIERVKKDHSKDPKESIKFLYDLRDKTREWEPETVDYMLELAQTDSLRNDPEVCNIRSELEEWISIDEMYYQYLSSKEYQNSLDAMQEDYEYAEGEMHRNYLEMSKVIAETEEFTKQQVDDLLDKAQQFGIRFHLDYEWKILSSLYKKLIEQFGGDNEITVKILDLFAEKEELPFGKDLKKAIEYRTRIYEIYKADRSKEYDPPLQYELFRLAIDEQESENAENALMYYRELRDIYEPGIIEISLEEINDRISKLEQIR